MDKWIQGMMSDPNWQKLFGLMSNKELAIRVIRKQKELFMNQDTMDMYDKQFDPTQGLQQFVSIYEGLDRKVMKDLGLDHHVADVTNFKIMKILVPLYATDPEILAELDYVVQIGNSMMSLNAGDPRPDVDLVSMETKGRIPLSQLHSRKNQPLIIIASSLS